MTELTPEQYRNLVSHLSLAGHESPEHSADEVLSIILTGDRHGKLNYKWDGTPRFQLYVQSPEPGEEDGWRFKVTVVDKKYMDSDGYPVEAIAAGNNWQEAFSSAAHMVESALNCEECVF